MSDTGSKKLPCPFCETVSQVDRAIFGASSERLSCPQCGQIIRDGESNSGNTPVASGSASSPAGFEPAFPVDGGALHAPSLHVDTGTQRPVFPEEPEPSPPGTTTFAPAFPVEDAESTPESGTGNLYTIPGTLTIRKAEEKTVSPDSTSSPNSVDHNPAGFYPQPVRRGDEPEKGNSGDFEFRASFEQPVETEKRRRPSSRLKSSATSTNPPKEAAHLESLSVPVEMQTDDSSSSWKIVVSIFLILVLLTGLGLQYAWYNPEIVRANPYTAGIVSLLCTRLPCPGEESDPSLDYQPVALQVRAHPDQEETLLVNFSFRNIASREVPFPTARLAFFTRNGERTVASREFMPTDYLEKELALLDLMPVGSQVQAEITIADPGPDAENYTLTFSR